MKKSTYQKLKIPLNQGESFITKIPYNSKERSNESALHSTRRVDVQDVVELGHHIYGICIRVKSCNKVGSGVDYPGEFTIFVASF